MSWSHGASALDESLWGLLRMNTFSVDRDCKPIDSLVDLMDRSGEGMVELKAAGVRWYLDFSHGRLRYCNHSQQTFSAVELHLQALGYEAAIEPSRRIFYQQGRTLPEPSNAQSFDSFTWSHRLVQQLAIQGTLSWEQANVVMTQLTKDSLEPVLWLSQATMTPLSESSTLYETYDTKWQGSRVDVLLDVLTKRFHIWQELSPLIQSPHQCPYFADGQRIYESVPGGLIPTSMLLALKHIMGGLSLRQLSQTLRQDELKLAQLLRPYVEHGLVFFDEPEDPLDQLPRIQPAETSSAEISPAETRMVAPLSSSTVIPPTATTARFQHPTMQPSRTTPVSLRSPSRSPTLGTQTNPTPTLYRPRPAASPSPNGSDLGASPSPPSPIPSKKQYKIVCIDDSPTMLETLKVYLEDECFEVTTLDNPMQSASAMFSSRPDLVLMDVAMPGIKGDRLCKILRQSSAFKNTPIIMVTGLTAEVDKAGAIAMGANDYLAKPFSQEALLELMDQYLHFSR